MNDLAVMHEELTSLPELPEVEWTRLRSLEFQETLRQRTSYLDRLVKLGCQLCENFEDHVSRLPPCLRTSSCPRQLEESGREYTDWYSMRHYMRSSLSRVV